jgi:hypothetical protein
VNSVNTRPDRRSSDRFPIEREVRYRMMTKRGGEETGVGRTVNISSSGVLFTSEQPLLPGRRLELSVSWPAQLDNKCPLKLVARGKVVRSEAGKVAIEIQQYEFRTAGSAAHPLRQMRADTAPDAIMNIDAAAGNRARGRDCRPA